MQDNNLIILNWQYLEFKSPLDYLFNIANFILLIDIYFYIWLYFFNIINRKGLIFYLIVKTFLLHCIILNQNLRIFIESSLAIRCCFKSFVISLKNLSLLDVMLNQVSLLLINNCLTANKCNKIYKIY